MGASGVEDDNRGSRLVECRDHPMPHEACTARDQGTIGGQGEVCTVHGTTIPLPPLQAEVSAFMP